LSARLDAATAHLDPPFALVDLDAFDANAADMERRAGGVRSPSPRRCGCTSAA
jgi:D-serine deaminase-like pyridoxal phosphate-dependent protein